MRPVTREQWQDAADSAEMLARLTTAQVLLFLEMGRLFGLVDNNGEIDIQACHEVIADARSEGIVYSKQSAWQFIDGES